MGWDPQITIEFHNSDEFVHGSINFRFIHSNFIGKYEKKGFSGVDLNFRLLKITGIEERRGLFI